MEIIYFGILLCSIAFFIAALYISIALRRVAAVTRSLGETVKQVEDQLKYITPEIKESIREVHNTMDEISEDIKYMDPLFDTAENVGKSVDHLNKTYVSYRGRINQDQMMKQLGPTVEAIKWAEAVTQVLKRWEKVN